MNLALTPLSQCARRAWISTSHMWHTKAPCDAFLLWAFKLLNPCSPGFEAEMKENKSKKVYGVKVIGSRRKKNKEDSLAVVPKHLDNVD